MSASRQKQPFPLRDRRHTGAALHSERFRSDCILGHRAISRSGGRPSGKSNASKRFRIAADLGSGTDCSIPSCQMVTLKMGQPKHPPAERGRQVGEIRRAPRQTCKSLEVRTKSFHDLLLQYDASQIDRTARVTHSDPCSHTGDCFQIGALGRGSGRQCAGAAVMKKATARERLGAFRKHATIRRPQVDLFHI